jgi:hypothetical protein
MVTWTNSEIVILIFFKLIFFSESCCFDREYQL